MKKLSLLLAALMIFCCFAMASCSEEEATSSTAPEASSTAPATSSEAPVSSEEPEASSEEPAESSEEELPLVGEAKTFWLTHFGDASVEGAGSIFTQSYSGAGWWLWIFPRAASFGRSTPVTTILQSMQMAAALTTPAPTAAPW